MSQENKIWIMMLLLFSLSAYMSFVYSPSLSELYNYDNSYVFFYKQLVAIFIGLAIVFMISRLGADKWFNKIGIALLALSSFFMIVMQFVPSSTYTLQGVKTYVVLGGLSIAPMLFLS